MSFEIFNLKLIPQDLNSACWYASTQMVVQWHRNKWQMTGRKLRDPTEVAYAVSVHKSNNGLPWAKMRSYAEMVGLIPAPLVTPSLELLETWLRNFGPLWTDGVPVDKNGKVCGRGHVVVIAGIRGSAAQSQFLVYDPWPPNSGDISWRPISHFVTMLSDGANSMRNVCILHLPT